MRRANGVAVATKRSELEDGAGLGNEIWAIEDAAEYLRCHPSTIYRMVKRDPTFRGCGFKLGSNWRFRREDIETWCASQSAVE